jgi:hypothetical protein
LAPKTPPRSCKSAQESSRRESEDFTLIQWWPAWNVRPKTCEIRGRTSGRTCGINKTPKCRGFALFRGKLWFGIEHFQLRKTVFYEQSANRGWKWSHRSGDSAMSLSIFLLYFNASDKLARISNCGGDHVAMSRAESGERIEVLPIWGSEGSKMQGLIDRSFVWFKSFSACLIRVLKLICSVFSTYATVCDVRECGICRDN